MRPFTRSRSPGGRLAQTAPFDGVVVAHPALLLDDRMSRTRPVQAATKALPASAGATAKAALWAGQ